MKKIQEKSEINSDELIHLLKSRFDKNRNRHADMDWNSVQERLTLNPNKIASLLEMEKTGGEPDVIGRNESTGEYLFCDCSSESPIGRRSLCYDQEGWESRKEFKPVNNAMDMANSMGIEMLDEANYRYLQSLGDFDTKTSSWIKTPDSIRKLGGALFGDFRFNTVFIYHNTAPSYYAARGFRGLIWI